MTLVRVLAAATVIGLLCSAACAAPDPDWHISFITIMNDTGTALMSQFGTKTGAIDWVGPEDCPPPDGFAAILSDDTMNAFAYTVMHGKVLTYDYRSPITNRAKTWDIWITATEPCAITLLADGIARIPFEHTVVGDYDGGLASLALWRGSDKLWDWQPHQAIAISRFDYTGSAIALRLVATPMPTPEPGSVIALLTGLCGLAGFARRRTVQR